jgi:xanthine dehydrogenase accessory factor
MKAGRLRLRRSSRCARQRRFRSERRSPSCLLAAVDGRTRLLDINLMSDDEVLGGTACGAVMEVVVWRPTAEFAATARAIVAGRTDVRFEISYDRAGDGVQPFSHTVPARAILLLVGATALTAEIAIVARRLDFHVVVVDPRPAFATEARVPDADEIVLEWPQDYLPAVLSENTSIIMLSHDPKVDLPALRCALRSNAAFIGLLGSRRSQASRRESLRADGFDELDLARIHGPVGLDIGGTTAAETALSILAEVVATGHRRRGEPLGAGEGAIHPVILRVAP